MTAGEAYALLGAAATLIGIIGGVVASYRTTSDKIQKGDDALHERVNRVRDEYVRRIDLDGHMSRLENNMKELRAETKEGTRDINSRLDTIMTSLQPNPPATPRRR